MIMRKKKTMRSAKCKNEKYEGAMGRGKKGAPGLFSAPLFDKISGVL